jgi:hypothetical protein
MGIPVHRPVARERQPTTSARRTLGSVGATPVIEKHDETRLRARPTNTSDHVCWISSIPVPSRRFSILSLEGLPGRPNPRARPSVQWIGVQTARVRLPRTRIGVLMVRVGPPTHRAADAAWSPNPPVRQTGACSARSDGEVPPRYGAHVRARRHDRAWPGVRGIHTLRLWPTRSS